MSLKRKASAFPVTDPKKPKGNGSITSFFGAPKAVSTTAKSNGNSSQPSSSPASSTWDKEAWVQKLTEEQRQLLALEIGTMHESWLRELKNDITSPSFLNLKRFLKSEALSGKKIFPPSEDVYAWSRHTPLNTVKAVILGQDPYHNVNQAHGLCFSVRPPTTPPPSLKNIFKCLAIDYPSFRPPPNNSGLLTPWADRGVLLLNTCLTVRAHDANSHADKGWEQLTQRVIDIVAAKRTRGVVFLAWGAPAGKRVAKINQKIHCVLKSVHPSPLSASRGWFECGHFKKTNEWLVKAYGAGSEIDWDLGEKKLEEEDEGKEVENIEKIGEEKVEDENVEQNGEEKVEDKLEEKVQEKHDEGEDKENKEN